MNLGRGGEYVFRQEGGFENVGSWMPVTPEKPVSRMRSNLINVDRQEVGLGRENWQQRSGLLFEQTQHISSYATEAESFCSSLQNGNPGLPHSFLDLLAGDCVLDDIALAGHNQVAIGGNDGMSWNENSFASTFEMENAAPSFILQNALPSGGIHMPNRPLMLDLNTQVDADWTIQECNMGIKSTTNSYYSNSKPWSGSCVPQDGNCYSFGPLATDQGRMTQYSCLSEIFNHPLAESVTCGRDSHEEAVTSKQNRSLEQHCDELLQSIVETPAPNDTAVKEVINEVENDQGIDLNKTPPQKPPKRRKHRPKVVIEGKPKRKPKPAVPQSADPKEKPAGKRKYVRKNNIRVSETKSASVSPEDNQTVGNAPKSCRRMLNFDLEGPSEENHSNIDEQQTEGRQAFNLNLDYQATVTCEETNNVLGPKPVQQNLLSLTNQHAEMACNIACSKNHIPSGIELQAKRCPPTASATTLKDLRKENINLASNANNHLSDPSLRRWSDALNSLQNRHAEGIIYSQDRSTPVDIERSRQLMWQRPTQAALKHAADPNEARRLKRGHHLTIWQNHTQNLASKDLPLHHQQIAQIGNYINLGTNLQKDFSEPDKRRKTESGLPPSIASILGRTFPSEVDSREFSINRNHISRQQTAADIVMPNRHHDSSSHSKDINSTSPILYAYNLLRKRDLIGSFSCGAVEENEHSNRSTQDFSLVTGNILLPPTPQKTDLRSQCDQETNSWLDNNLARKQVEVGIVSKVMSSCSDAAPLSGDKQPNEICSTDSVTIKKSSKSAAPKVPSAHRGRRKAEKKMDQLPSTSGQGMPNEHTWSDLLDQITSQFKDLGIADPDQNAIVPYKADGTMVAFVAKKRKPRPKVDLDPETERLWKLLMGSENSEGTKGTDKDKEKWWEEERKIFRGRADSFIARMHLVQGDRRFSKWKGSVVDSVIGVFLTQNVSDHLSSSAFMALASRFPVRTTSSRTCCEDEKGIIVEEPEVSFEEQDNGVKLHDEVLSQPLSDGNSSVVESPPKAPEPATQNESSACHEYTSRNFSEVPGAQVFHSSVVEDPARDESFVEWRRQQEVVKFNQTLQKMRKLDEHDGYSGYTSVANHSNYHGRVQTVLPSNYRLHIPPDPRVQAENLQLFGKGIMPSWSSCDSEIINLNSLEWTSNRFGQNPQGSDDMVVKLNELSRQQHSPILKVSSNMPLQHIESRLNEGFNVKAAGHSSKYNSNQETRIFLDERASVINSTKHAEGLVGQKGSNMLHISSVLEPRGTLDVEERASVQNEQILMKNKVQTFEGSEHHGTMQSENTAKSKPRKVKVSEKKHAFDWDSLRMQAQSKCTRGKTKETMDSMDYEAIRNATVNEISNTIRERGMNNMLADRIKDFLDRTVREHGSIDLEWLRDAPPDKVKDYLLSIRGLGLKSVECVRLLTLHHLAFPVDTNVGRIAVRLGWVPLQPLPESLQLHLLEMYPMLESIQKYLWPRLCKLDQRTLYELHYQMITFGKVFCTKSKPNCNACPMRGECRHFASAFASARLALPGPEEKRIVTSSVPTTAEMNTAVYRNPVMLPQLEDTTVEERLNAICEPIIEEPASPEQEPECVGVTESDIEDAFWEDPDEIPTIKLNIKSFTQNLQNYMQENNYEVQDGDMSKALVALNPAAASIPTQKLKNVSRLRTEHQVYELPDSHPLLKPFERREPDDPSPYLLAIWTPGETANSTGAPESQCGSQDSGKLCDNMTCFSCNSTREANSNTVRGTILIPCRTAMRGSFPLNGTYFQVNEMFADHDSSIDPLNIPRLWIWNLPRRTVFFGTSVSSIFKGLSTEQIQFCFWRGFVCVRGFDKKSRAPKPLMARLHFPASKMAKAKDEKK